MSKKISQRNISFDPLSEEEERIAKLAVDSAYVVHKSIGPGLLEKIYEVCFCHELSKRGLKNERQVNIPLVYDNIVFEKGFKLDVLIEKSVICEIKAVEKMNPLWDAQILSYLKLSNIRLGFLINFNVPLIKNGIKRIIL